MQGTKGPSPGQLNTLSPQPFTWAVTSASGRGQYGGTEAEVVAATVDQRERKFSPDCRTATYSRYQEPRRRQRAAVTERARRRPLKGRCGP